jgi:predicted RNase H-like nuclease (RuvC/YqgF family)
MSSKLILRGLALLIAVVFFHSLCLAAQDAPSVAEAARRAREKQATSKPAKVITDDALTHAPTTPSATASPTPSSSAAQAENAPAAPSGEQPTAQSDEETAKKKGEIEALKREIADKQQSIKLLQREIALAQDTFYSNPNHEHDRAGNEKLDSMRSDVEQQQAALAELQAKLEALGPVPDSKSSESPETPKP